MACRGDTSGCGSAIAPFLACIPNSDFSTCAISFASQAGSTDAGSDLANDFATCLQDDNDAGTRCAEICAGDGG
jgi:hypothetical protein